MLKKAIFYIITFLGGYVCFAQPSVERNLDYQYDPIPNISCKYIVLDEDDSLKIYATFHIKRLEGQNARFLSPSRFEIRYNVFADYLNPTVLFGDSLYRMKTNFKPDKAQIWFSFKVHKPSAPSAVLFISVHDNELDETTQFDIPLVINKSTVGQYYGIFTSKGKEPLFANYFTVKDTVQFRKMTDRYQKLIVFRYNYDFDPAAPPMQYIPRPNKEMQIDCVFSVRADSPLRFKKAAFYFVQEDTTTTEGFSFTVKEFKYPKLSRAKELIGPLAYITKNEEYEELVRSKFPKLAVDDFWQNFGNNDQNAKKQIKLFYSRAEKANELFTSFKDGWKTDMGMIYIMYGKPSRVIRQFDKEFWTYVTANNSQIIFTFDRKPTIFTPKNFELEREKYYETSYLSNVQQWRKGLPPK